MADVPDIPIDSITSPEERWRLVNDRIRRLAALSREESESAYRRAQQFTTRYTGGGAQPGGTPGGGPSTPPGPTTGQVTGWSVTIEESTASGISAYRWVFAWDTPSDPLFDHVLIDWRQCDSAFAPTGSGIFTYFDERTDPGPKDPFLVKPPAAQYWQFRARAVTANGDINESSPPISNVTVPAGSGLPGLTPPGTAPQVTSFSVAGPFYYLATDGERWSWNATWANPSSSDFEGVELTIQRGSGSGGTFAAMPNSPERFVGRFPASYTSGGESEISVPEPTDTYRSFRIRAYSFNANGERNTASPPTIDLTNVQKQFGAAGAEYAPVVTLNAAATNIEQGYSADGIDSARVVAAWTNPADLTKYGGAHIVLATNPASASTYQTLAIVSPQDVQYTGSWLPKLDASLNYYILVFSIDKQGRRNSYAAGTTPAKGPIAIAPSAGNLKAQRLGGEWTVQGDEKVFEGIRIKEPNGAGGYPDVAWIGNALGDSTTLTVASIVGATSVFVANDLIFVAGDWVLLKDAVDPSKAIVFRVQGVDYPTNRVDVDKTSTGLSALNIAFSINSPITVIWQGAWMRNLWVGASNPRSAPFYVDASGNVVIDNSADPTVKPLFRIVDAANSIQTSLRGEVEVIDGASYLPGLITRNTALNQIAQVSHGRIANFAQSGSTKVNAAFTASSGGSPLATIEASHYAPSTGVQSFLVNVNSLGSQLTMNATAGGFGAAWPFDFLLNLQMLRYTHGIDGDLLKVTTQNKYVEARYGLRCGTGTLLEVVNSAGNVLGRRIRHRFFNSTWADASVKAELEPGEIATRYDPSFRNVLVWKHDDGSGNAFWLNNDGTL